MLTQDVAPGVHRIEHAYTNCYLIDDGDGITVVDTGLPKVWPELLAALKELGRTPTDISAVIITHAHFDHIGCAARLRRELNVPVWMHQAETHIAAHPYQYDHEENRFLYPLTHPKSLPIMLAMSRAGALSVPGVTDVKTFLNPPVLDVPGKPVPLPTPGHTFGHTAFYLKDRDVLLTGDALVTLNPYTGLAGPALIPGAATADTAQAMRSLDALMAYPTASLLPGHGDPWSDGAESAIRLARAAADK